VGDEDDEDEWNAEIPIVSDGQIGKRTRRAALLGPIDDKLKLHILELKKENGTKKFIFTGAVRKQFFAQYEAVYKQCGYPANLMAINNHITSVKSEALGGIQYVRSNMTSKVGDPPYNSSEGRALARNDNRKSIRRRYVNIVSRMQSDVQKTGIQVNHTILAQNITLALNNAFKLCVEGIAYSALINRSESAELGERRQLNTGGGVDAATFDRMKDCRYDDINQVLRLLANRENTRLLNKIAIHVDAYSWINVASANAVDRMIYRFELVSIDDEMDKEKKAALTNQWQTQFGSGDRKMIKAHLVGVLLELKGSSGGICDECKEEINCGDEDGNLHTRYDKHNASLDRIDLTNPNYHGNSRLVCGTCQANVDRRQKHIEEEVPLTADTILVWIDEVQVIADAYRRKQTDGNENGRSRKKPRV